ncbi:putative quinol monooxygenase [Lactococcus kimchii]|uniref:putative quinol monooxygenase n=1 Tax=Lactococcus sp. S-13 TaxID=2507158 RepID=UPI0010237695|nr:putative quinol monooxygenase [Lactococcus sp. S-13]RZI48244.1 antibiotic biosynthesis monooxygenase [Lactococcus sp. S-13]
MSLIINIIYRGKGDAAQKFAQEMLESGTVAEIRAKSGNLRYDYFQPLDDPEALLLIDAWENQAALDAHHKSHRMNTIAKLRDKYNLRLSVTRLTEYTEDK